MEKHMDLKTIKSSIVDPVCESLDKLAKSKYIVKISENEGNQVFSKLAKAIKSMIDEPLDSWLEEDDRKDQRSYKIQIVKSMTEIISVISKNDKIRNNQMDDDETVDILIDLFLWSNRNIKNENIRKIYEKLIDVICSMINIKSNKYFIPSAFVQEIDKIKRKTISHGLLSLLLDIYEDEATDLATKRFINTKVLVNAEQQDIKDAIEVVKACINNEYSENKEDENKNSKTPSKHLMTHHSPSKSDPMLAITGSALHTYSPRVEQIAKGLFNEKLKNLINLQNNLEILERFSISIEERQQKIKLDEENRKRKVEEIKKTQDDHMSKHDRKLKAKRKAPIPMFPKDENNLNEDQAFDKLKLVKEDSNNNYPKEKQADEEFKDMNKQNKNDDPKQLASKKGNRNSKATKNSSFYQVGKAIVFQ